MSKPVSLHVPCPDWRKQAGAENLDPGSSLVVPAAAASCIEQGRMVDGMHARSRDMLAWMGIESLRVGFKLLIGVKRRPGDAGVVAVNSPLTSQAVSQEKYPKYCARG